MEGWNVLRVFCGVELAVEAAVIERGFDAYCPVFTQPRRNRYGRRGEIVEVTRPLFPGYLFARPGPGFRTSMFETSRTVVRLLRGSTGRIVVNDDQMAVVRNAALEASRVAVERKVQAGDYVVLLRGLLKGETAVVLRVRGQTALVSINRSRPVEAFVNASDVKVCALATG